MDPQVLQQLGLTEDQIAQLMQLGVLQDEKGILNQELEMAQQLRQTPGPRGRYTGRAFVAANPLEFLGRGLDRVRGSMETARVTEAQRENARRAADARQQYLSAILRQPQRPAGATMTPSQVGPGGITPPQMTPAQMFPMPGGAGATMTPAMLRRR